FVSGLPQEPVDFEPMFLGEGRQSGHGITFIHISTTIEMMYACQAQGGHGEDTMDALDRVKAGLTGKSLVAAMCVGQVGNLLPHVVVPAGMPPALVSPGAPDGPA